MIVVVHTPIGKTVKVLEKGDKISCNNFKDADDIQDISEFVKSLETPYILIEIFLNDVYHGELWHENEMLLKRDGLTIDIVLKALFSAMPEAFSLEKDEFRAFVAAKKLELLETMNACSSPLVVFDHTCELEGRPDKLYYVINELSPFFQPLFKYFVIENLPMAYCSTKADKYVLNYKINGKYQKEKMFDKFELYSIPNQIERFAKKMKGA